MRFTVGILTIWLVGCGHAGEVRVVPQGLVGVSFEGREHAPVRRLSLDEALRLRARVDEAFRAAPGQENHERWFFHGFDERSLYFFVGRFHTVCRGLGCMRYRVDDLLAVSRSAKAEAAFGVASEMKLWEAGVGGVHGGMSPDEVRLKLGEPRSVELLQYTGSFRWSYPTLSVTFLGNQVAWVHARR